MNFNRPFTINIIEVKQKFLYLQRTSSSLPTVFRTNYSKMKEFLSSTPGHQIFIRITRISSIIIDFLAIILLLKLIPYSTNNFWNTKIIQGTQPQIINEISPWLGILIYLTISLYLNKDIIRGQSLGKQILKLQIVSNSTGKAATVYQCFIRNLFLVFLGPIELVISFINPSRRIGDIVAGTTLISYDPDIEQPGLNFLQIGFCIIMPVLVLIAITYVGSLFHFS